MNYLFVVLFFLILFMFTILPEIVMAQEVTLEQIQELEKKINNLESEVSKDLSELSNQQNNLIDFIEQHDTNSISLAENVTYSLQQTSNNFWSSLILGTIITTSLAIIGIFVAVIISIKPAKHEEGTSIKYGLRWIFVGFIIGALAYVLGNSLISYFG